MYPQHMKADIVSVLTNTQRIISKGWCRRHKAIDISLKPCHTSSIGAVDYCLLGAIERNCRGDLDLEQATLELLEHFIPRQHRGLGARSSVTKFNDRCVSVNGPLKLLEITLDAITR